MRRSLLTVLTAALAVGGALAVPAQAAAPTVDLQPHQLARGADIVIPHIEDGALVDGARRIDLPGTDAELLGASGDAYVASTWRTNAVGETRSRRIVRVEADGSIRELLRPLEAYGTVLSEDGSRLLTASGDRTSQVRVWSAVDGTEIAARTFRRYPEVVAADGRRVLVRTVERLQWWRVGRDSVRTVTRALTGQASIEHDVLVTYTEDPYLGGCTRLARLSRPGTTVWRSCRDRVAAFSPDGTHMLTFDILTDGLGPGEVRLRELDGTLLATYRTNWFSGWEWEARDTLLLHVNGSRKYAVVRCALDDCENATDPVPVQAP
ncbi:hypothetical protein ASG76_09705 [Nocardioides sp. Soil774]|uniref:hypothetical protein n=1 Tax=Nocardioides sp. Soil774 TaxID=1736408 RepID=UPI0006FC523B|nr:hypothetical protein [Nocardioides sp. Soil774]KRE94676.1 hypothetical protein ASG76_09705 [Nocardioides sp. Soil774]